jgi:hypothetical protein
MIPGLFLGKILTWDRDHGTGIRGLLSTGSDFSSARGGQQSTASSPSSAQSRWGGANMIRGRSAARLSCKVWAKPNTPCPGLLFVCFCGIMCGSISNSRRLHPGEVE